MSTHSVSQGEGRQSAATKEPEPDRLVSIPGPRPSADSSTEEASASGLERIIIPLFQRGKGNRLAKAVEGQAASNASISSGTESPTHAPPDHARETVHGGVTDPTLLLALLPSTETPGFDLIPPRAAHVLLALLAHLRAFGYVVERNHGNFTVTEPQATWTVQGLANACGIGRNQAGKALADLVDLGYLRREDLRRNGQYGGFAYALRLPTDLTPQGKHRLKTKLKDKHVDLAEWTNRASRYLSQEELDEIFMVLDKDDREGEAGAE
jgi:predicted transcriptional regulator